MTASSFAVTFIVANIVLGIAPMPSVAVALTALTLALPVVILADAGRRHMVLLSAWQIVHPDCPTYGMALRAVWPPRTKARTFMEAFLLASLVGAIALVLPALLGDQGRWPALVVGILASYPVMLGARILLTARTEHTAELYGWSEELILSAEPADD